MRVVILACAMLLLAGCGASQTQRSTADGLGSVAFDALNVVTGF